MSAAETRQRPKRDASPRSVGLAHPRLRTHLDIRFGGHTVSVTKDAVGIVEIHEVDRRERTGHARTRL